MEEAQKDVSENGRILFNPPLWSQRLRFVCEEVKKHGAKKVVDYGCGAGRLLLYLKQVDGVSTMFGLDVHGPSLYTASRELEPLFYDRVRPRHEPRTITLLKGSVDVVDGRLAGADLLASVEVIEHLHAPALQAFPSVVFGTLRPAVAVITTPNREYNVLFGWEEGATARLRDADHKFEWTRTEFQNWCQAAAHDYGYDVTFTGVGDPPPTHQHLGWATQIAAFVRRVTQHTTGPVSPLPSSHPSAHVNGNVDDHTLLAAYCAQKRRKVDFEPHELVANIVYPVDEYTQEQRAEIDAVACCRRLALMGRNMDGGITCDELWSLMQSPDSTKGPGPDWLLTVLRSSRYFAQMDTIGESWALVDDESDGGSGDWSDVSV